MRGTRRWAWVALVASGCGGEHESVRRELDDNRRSWEEQMKLNRTWADTATQVDSALAVFESRILGLEKRVAELER